MEIDLDRLKRVHCVGIGGIGVSAAAKFLRSRGVEVTGSDAVRSVVTEEAEQAGVRIAEPSAENVTPELDLIIYTSAAPEMHPEREAARVVGIPEMSYFEFLGLVSRRMKTVAVCGTNGKSTTTAMLALMLERAGLDPTVIVGSRVPSFPQGNFRPGRSDLLVVEACEYRAQFLHLRPSMAVATKIVEDHLDYYRDLAHIQETFQAFAGLLPKDGTLIWNADDEPSRAAFAPLGIVQERFGLSAEAEARILNPRVREGMQAFDLAFGEETWKGLELPVPGAFNVQNAAAAAAAARKLGAQESAVRAALAEFRGIWRRFERVGTRRGAPVVSDYGHTPDAVEATLAAAREWHPGRRIVLVFQPHHHDRTRKLFDGFVAALAGADELILTEIYGVKGRTDEHEEISSRDLLDALAARRPDLPARYAEDAREAARLVTEADTKDAMILVMGAGDIDAAARELCPTP